jgi:hypothetical protein
MKRWACNIACLLSLLVTAVILMLWARSDRIHSRIGYSTNQARYTLHLHKGKLTLMGPPSSAKGQSTVDTRQAIARLKNRDCAWSIIMPADTEEAFRLSEQLSRIARARQNGSTDTLDQADVSSRTYNLGLSCERFGPDLKWTEATSWEREPFIRPLLLALDDPDRFIAAHALLKCLGSTTVVVGECDWRGAKSSIGNSDPLCIELLPDAYAISQPFDDFKVFKYTAQGAWRADPSQLPRIRDYWHDRLDVTIASFPIWSLLIPSLLLPALSLRHHLRQSHRRKNGLCPTCGYNLKATPTRCPESGHTAPNP